MRTKERFFRGTTSLRQFWQNPYEIPGQPPGALNPANTGVCYNGLTRAVLLSNWFLRQSFRATFSAGILWGLSASGHSFSISLP